MAHGIEQPGCNIAAAFLKVQYRAPPVSSASYESGFHGRNVKLDIFDAGVRIVVLRPSIDYDHRLAGFNNRQTLADSCYDRPFSDRPSRGRVIREMGGCPRPQLMIVG